MSETIMLPIKDKATAMQYAISQARVFNKETRCYDLDLELAKNIFKLFCDNVNLPDVGNGNIVFVPQDNSSASMSCDPNFLVDNDGCVGNPVFNEHPNEDFERICEQTKKYSGDSENKEETTAKTYEDVAKELFDKPYYYINRFGKIEQLNDGYCFHYAEPNNCTSQKQAEKLLAINRLMNVAKYLNGDWRPDWRNEGEAKFCIILNNGNLHIDLDLFTTCNNSFAYFRSKELAQQAIDILGEDTIRLALSTDW